ncbi:major facilitator superfamily transporter multidrug resistance [Colletotrichum scovillei]|nr:major facilitator superfamily transporter multidrug resistance [Colletotrichum scovillei]
MPSITDIPCELVASILRSLDDFETLTSFLLACRHIYTSFQQIPGTELAIIRQRIEPDLLPYAVASLDASKLQPSPGDESSFRSLLDLLYDAPSQLVARTASMPPELLRSMSRKHDWVTTLALSYAAEAKIHISSDIITSSEAVDLSPSEYFRFCRAFYRVDLFYFLFGAVGNFHALSGVGNLLLDRHPPWENEQLGCVHDFIETKFLEASINVFAQKALFGEYQTNYLMTGPNNFMIQIWLSHGLDFLRRLMSANSHESKRVLLVSAINAGWTSLPEALLCIMDFHPHNNTNLEDLSTSELATIIPAYENICNTDKGPYAGWYAANTSVPPLFWVYRRENRWLRRRAYVFWDWVYVREPDILKLFATASEEDD